MRHMQETFRPTRLQTVSKRRVEETPDVSGVARRVGFLSEHYVAALLPVRRLLGVGRTGSGLTPTRVRPTPTSYARHAGAAASPAYRPRGRSGNGSMTSDRGDPRWVLAGDGLQATHHRPQGPDYRPPANVTLPLVTMAVRTSSATPRVGRDDR